jgi:hypothetical protein
MVKRQKLTDTPLGRRVAGKGAAAVPAAPAAAAPANQTRSGRPAGAKGVVVQMNREGWLAINHLALELDTSLQKLGIEAFNDLLERHGRGRPIVNPYGQG